MTRMPLECGCKKDYPVQMPQVGNLILCREHDITAVAAEKVGVWTAQCLNCTYRRYPGDYGGTTIQAEILAAKHMTSRRHIVYSYRIGDFNGTHKRHAPTVKVATTPDSPPPF